MQGVDQVGEVTRPFRQEPAIFPWCPLYYLGPLTFNPNSDFRNLPFGPKPVLRTLSEHLFGVKPRQLPRNKFVPRQLEIRPRLTRQIPKLAKTTSDSGFKVWDQVDRERLELRPELQTQFRFAAWALTV